MESMKKRPDHPDFLVTTNDGVPFGLHKALLFNRWPLFRESQERCRTNIQKIDSGPFKQILEYLYAGLMPSESLRPTFGTIGIPFPSSDFREKYIADMRRLYTEKTCSDFKISAHGKIFSVHRFILASSSEFFYSLFSSGFEEDVTQTMEDPFSTSIKQIESMLSYIYTGEVVLSSVDECLQFLYICKKYIVKAPSPREPETMIATLITSKFMSEIDYARSKAVSYSYKVLSEILSACLE